MRLKPRDFTRTEHDDYVLNIQPYLDWGEETVEVRSRTGSYSVGKSKSVGSKLFRISE